MHCLWCFSEMDNQFSWSDVFLLKKLTGLCDDCKNGLEFLRGNRCEKCSRKSETTVCQDCKWWKEALSNDPLVFNHSVFRYNPFLQEVISKWKYRGDFVLGEIFRPYMQQAYQDILLKMKKDVIVVPIPLSEKRLMERAFNQAEMLARFLPVKTELLLERTEGEKQAKKTREDRINTKNPFLAVKIIKKPVLLVDDIYTTGTTLRHAASSLAASGCPEVYALTLIRG